MGFIFLVNFWIPHKFYRLGMSGANPILMVAERKVLTSLKEAAASRVATMIHWETVSVEKKEFAEDVNLANVEDNTSTKVAYKPRLGDLDIPNTLQSEIKRFL